MDTLSAAWHPDREAVSALFEIGSSQTDDVKTLTYAAAEMREGIAADCGIKDSAISG
jgi:hypothetical protein